MTREQRADALLEAARRWQNSEPARYCWYGACPEFAASMSYDDTGLVRMSQDNEIASAALSEAAALGFDLEGADGTPTEKVARFTQCGGVRREDGSEYAIYKAVRRVLGGRS